MKELLGKSLQRYGYSKDALVVINIDRQDIQGISSLPTIDLCGKRLIGIQDEESVASGVLGAAVRTCFSSSRKDSFISNAGAWEM